MDRTEQIFNIVKNSAHKLFEQIQGLIEEHCNRNSGNIAAELVTVFRKAFLQAAHLQRNQLKGAIRYLVLSHLASSILEGRYLVKLDIYDYRCYADTEEIDAYLALDWLYGFLSEDMNRIRKELISQRIMHPSVCELEQIRYRYVYYYHAVALKLISKSIPALLELPEFLALNIDTGLEVFFGGYMDKVVAVWPEMEGDNEVFPY